MRARHRAERAAAFRREADDLRTPVVRGGTAVEQAYRNLHAAKIFLVDLLGEAEEKAEGLVGHAVLRVVEVEAYAFHRQLPYGVPGACRLLANLLSLGTP